MIADSPKLFTLDAYHAFCDQPEQAGRLYELIAGEIVEKMPSITPSMIAMLIGHLLLQYLETNRIGGISGPDGGYIIAADTVLIPDVGYISYARMPALPAREAPVPPDLAVEVKSPTDRLRDLRTKAERYLAAGTRLVWLVLPETQTVEVYSSAPGTDVITLGAADAIDGGDVLPGFSASVSAFFPSFGAPLVPATPNEPPVLP